MLRQNALLTLIVLILLSTHQNQQYGVSANTYLKSIEREAEFSSPLLDQELEQLQADGFVPTWPAGKALDRIGAIGGVSFGPDGRIYVFHRDDRIWTDRTFDVKNEYAESRYTPIANPTIFVFSKELWMNQPLSIFGENRFFLPHGIFVDDEDNVWVTDVALHQVIKFKPSGNHRWTVDLTLGERFVPGNDSRHFCKPTHVAVAPNGDFFVADGYCNSRLLKFDKSGKLILIIGEGLFLVPHHLALIESTDEICVADRENLEVKCFDAGLHGDAGQTGTLTRTIDTKDLGPPYAISYGKKDDVLAVLGGIRNQITRADVAFYKSQGGFKEISTRLSLPNMQGFLEGHSMAFCRQGGRLLVGALEKSCPLSDDESCQNSLLESRNLWFFK